MKKLAAAVACVIGTAFILSGCSGKNTNNNSSTKDTTVTTTTIGSSSRNESESRGESPASRAGDIIDDTISGGKDIIDDTISAGEKVVDDVLRWFFHTY